MLIETIEELLILAKKYKYSNENIELIKSAYVIAANYSTNKFDTIRLKMNTIVTVYNFNGMVSYE